MRNQRWLAVLLIALAFQCLVGCASPGQGPDPWEKNNRAMYQFNDNLDHYLLKPVSDAYIKYVPKMVRTGVHNGFNNLGYFETIFNDFAQGNFPQGFKDSGRMAINSSIGCLGWFDPATQMGLPSHDNDFGITLGKWGVPQQPYIVLPLFGPSTTRDVSSIPVGIACNPLTYYDLSTWISLPLGILQVVDGRADAERYLKFRNDNAIDPYVFTRDAYLQYRANQIQEAGGPAPKPTNQPSIYDEDTDSATTAPATSTAPATQPATRP
jgi:phospholipid-binding lipoprotein MlaA